ncbi:glutamate receptor 4 [Calliopsis andreniformis]|uniref:glutamate receptor 4 n=1 Tax=Calliopsis andreniformis TaxID=337506 RepID=UPI003FCEAA73
MVVTIDNMHQLAKYYNNIVCPLIVVLISGEPMFYEFSKTSKTFNMSFATWLVIFIPTSMNAMHNYCYRPPGNPFHLRFDSKMLVLCGTDPIVREWYSVDGKTTEIFELAKWYTDRNLPNVSTKIDMLTNLSLYDRRADLKGIVLRGVIVKDSMLAKLDGNKVNGYFGKVIDHLQKSLNFTIDIVTKVDNHGSYNATAKVWNGAMKLVATGEVDIGVSEFSMTNLRFDYVDFTVPLLTTRFIINLKKSHFFGVKWYAYYKTFSFTIWLSVAATIIIAYFVLSLIRSYVESQSIKEVLYDEFIRVWGILCQQGLAVFPPNLSLRLAYFSISIYALLLYAAYSAMLICFLTAQYRGAPFQSIEEFIKDGTFSIIVGKDSADYDMFTDEKERGYSEMQLCMHVEQLSGVRLKLGDLSYSKDPLSVGLMKLMKPFDSLPVTIEDAYIALCNDEKVALYTNNDSEMKRRSKFIHVPCKVFNINVGRVDTLSMILTKDNQYTDVVNHHLRKLLDSGLLNRYKIEVGSHEKSKIEPVDFGSVASVLMILFCGVSTAFIILIAEIYYFKYKSTKDIDRS